MAAYFWLLEMQKPATFSKKEYEATRRRLQELQKPKRCAVEPPSPTRGGGRLSEPGSPISERLVMPETARATSSVPRDRVGRREVTNQQLRGGSRGFANSFLICKTTR